MAGTHLVDKESLVGTPESIDIFSVPLTQVAVVGSQWVNVRSKNVLDDSGPWTFELQSGPMFPYPCRNYLFMKLKLERSDDNAALDVGSDLVAPVNKIGATFIKSLRVYLGGKLISDSSDLYAYQSMMETELNYCDDAKKSGHLRAALYAPSEPAAQRGTVGDLSWQFRRDWFITGNEIEVMCPITCDLFNTRKALPSRCHLRIEIFRNSDDFLLTNHTHAPNEARRYHLKLEDMFWRVQLLELSKPASLALEGTLARSPAKYAVRQTKMVRLSIPKRVTRIPQNTLCTGQIPRRIVLGMVRRDAFTGHKRNDPFQFLPFDCTQISISAAGRQYPKEPYRMNYGKNQYMHPFIGLLETLGLGAPLNQGAHITPELYKTGLCLYGFDLTADSDAGSDHWDLTHAGATSVEGEFGGELAADVELICLLEFDGLIRIDTHRQAHLTFMS